MKECYLYQKSGDYVQCATCSHRCRIAPYKRGVCGVRENQKGKLYLLVYGRLIAENIDPIEKKPLYHFLPGTKSLSIATVGCNLRCDWCFPKGTKIMTDRGILNIEEIADKFPKTQIISHLGQKRKIKSIFKRYYNDKLTVIIASHLPPIESTPNHQFYVAEKPISKIIQKIPASHLTKQRFLIIPKNHLFSKTIEINIQEILSQIPSQFKIRRKISYENAQQILKFSLSKTSKEIGQIFQLHPAYVRTLRSRLKNSLLTKKEFYFVDNRLIIENSSIRFKTEKKPYLKKFIQLNKELAYLLGFYCAEGWIVKNKSRPNSYSLHFALNKKEKQKAELVLDMFKKIFGLNLNLSEQQTYLELSNAKSSIALIFKILCGSQAKIKKVPEEIFQAKKEIVSSFLDGYIAGDGYTDKKGQIITNTISEQLAYDIYGLWLKLGFLPGFYIWKPSNKTTIEKRIVNQSPLYYVKVWRSARRIKSRYYEDEKFFYVPIIKTESRHYSGWVYNLEVEDDHSYLANFASVSNCQNYDISQATKDDVDRRTMMELGIEMTPEQVVKDAQKYHCPSISYTYTEPTIFLEFALDTMKLARKARLKNVWVSNGYMTAETLDLIAPYLDAINVDLKGFDEKNYLKYSGAKLQPVLDNIKEIHKRKIHLEITTLVIPNINDDKNQLESIAQFIASVSQKIPWHISRFFPAYKMTDTAVTPMETLKLAESLGKKAGLKYIHIGNV